MIDTKTNPKIKDDVIKSDRWKNLYFHKDGTTHWGLSIFPTEREAKEKADEAVKGWRENPDARIINCLPRIVRGRDCSHAIQIPLKG